MDVVNAQIKIDQLEIDRQGRKSFLTWSILTFLLGLILGTASMPKNFSGLAWRRWKMTTNRDDICCLLCRNLNAAIGDKFIAKCCRLYVPSVLSLPFSG